MRLEGLVARALALLGIGLAGIGFGRRRRAYKRVRS
jgi:hypothetical protein